MKVKKDAMRKLFFAGIILAFIIFFSAMSPYFFTLNNLASILQEASFIGIIALGMTFVIIASGIDLSVGSIVAFVAMLGANFLHHTVIPVILFLPILILVGGLLGFINGSLIVKLKIPDFIITLSMMGIIRGLTLMIAIRKSGYIRNIVIQNKDFLSLSGMIYPIYYVVIVFIVLAIISHIILKKTRIGTYTYAIGTSLSSSQLSGIDDGIIKIFVYSFTGIMCAISSIFLSSRLMTATAEMGSGMELKVIAAVVVGGTAFSGGRGDIFGTILGALFMALIQNGIYKFQISAAYQSIIMGGIIVLAVMFDEFYKKKLSRSRD